MAAEGSGIKSVTGIMTSCTANAAQTAAGITKADNGLGLANADTVKLATTTVTNDSIQLNHQFTASGDVTAKGFGILNDDDDVLYGLCCFASDLIMSSGDKLAVQMTLQVKVGAS